MAQCLMKLSLFKLYLCFFIKSGSEPTVLEHLTILMQKRSWTLLIGKVLSSLMKHQASLHQNHMQIQNYEYDKSTNVHQSWWILLHKIQRKQIIQIMLIISSNKTDKRPIRKKMIGYRIKRLRRIFAICANKLLIEKWVVELQKLVCVQKMFN